VRQHQPRLLAPASRHVRRTARVRSACGALVLLPLLAAGCTAPHTPAFARAANPDFVERCPDGVIAIPDVAFEGLGSSAVLDELRERRLLPAPEPVIAARYDREAAQLAGPAIYGGTSGPRIIDPGELRIRLERYRNEGGRRIGLVAAALVDADGVVVDTRIPVPREFLRRDEWRRGLVSAGADHYAARRLVRDTRFYPAMHSGCRVPAWTVVFL
jgi:hypothetical protein